MGLFHVDVELISAAFHLAQGQDLRLRVVLGHGVVTRLQMAAVADGLGNHDLAAA